jgi:hypothetical protein
MGIFAQHNGQGFHHSAIGVRYKEPYKATLHGTSVYLIQDHILESSLGILKEYEMPFAKFVENPYAKTVAHIFELIMVSARLLVEYVRKKHTWVHGVNRP